MTESIDSVFRDFNTPGLPASGEYEPEKSRIRALLKQIQNSGGQAVTRNTLAGLIAVTPPNENYMGIVLNDPDATKSGYYYRSGAAWVFGRGFPDTFARIALAGNGSAQTGTVKAGVNPAATEVFFAIVDTTNIGPMTLSIEGEPPRQIINLAGLPLVAGEWTGAVIFFLNGDGNYQLLIDAGAAASAAASATEAKEAVDDLLERYLGPHPDDAAATAAAGTPVTGQMYYNTTDGKFRVWNGVAWQDQSTGLSDGEVVFSKLADSLVQTAAEGGNAGADDQLPTVARVESLMAPQRTATLVNAMRAKGGTGPVSDGSSYVDLLFDRRSIDVDDSSGWQFALGGVVPTTTEGAPTALASATLNADSGAFLNHTIGVRIAASQITQSGKRVRVRFSASTTENLYIRGAVIGHAQTNGGTDLDRAVEPSPLHFGTGTDWWQKDIALNTTAWAEADFEMQAGRDVLIWFYVANDAAKDGIRYTSTIPTGWSCYYKPASNEAAKFAKVGYSVATWIIAVDRLEIVPIDEDAIDLISEQLTASAPPVVADAVVLVEIDPGDIADLDFSLSRDGATWKAVALSHLYDVEGQSVLGANGIDLTSGAGSGSALFWRTKTAAGVYVTLAGVGLSLANAVFTTVPSVRIEKGDPVHTHHFEKTGLGYLDSGAVRYGRLWGFTQEFEVEGPTRFHFKFHAQVEMLNIAFPNPTTHPVGTTPVMFAVLPTMKYAVDAATMGPKQLVVTDYPGLFGNREENWIAPASSGNVVGTAEHYKEAKIARTIDVMEPGVYRFEMWGISATDADPGVAGRIALNHEEAYIASAGRNFRYNELEITPEILR